MKDCLSCAIAFNFHDSSVAFAEGSEIKLVLEAERVFKQKKMLCSPNQMEVLVKYGLALLGKRADDVDYWALSTLNNPWSPASLRFSTTPVWSNVVLFGKQRKTLIVNHHFAHASAYLLSPYSEALIISCDGGGDDDAYLTAFKADNLDISEVSIKLDSTVSARAYDRMSTYLYGAPFCEGKLMALSAYGCPQEQHIERLNDLREKLHTARDHEFVSLLSFAFPELCGKARHPTAETCDLAASFQYWFQEHRVDNVSRLVQAFGAKNLVLVGGACLNLQANSEIWRRSLTATIPYIPPCCDDTGQSIGALCCLIRDLCGRKPTAALPYLGAGSPSIAISNNTTERLVNSLINDEVLLVHNGKAEVGPRALGHRSFIARSDSRLIKKIISEKIKKREPYRPLAPIVPEELVSRFFCGPDSSPFMLYNYRTNDSMHDKLAGVVHSDSSARVQTVTESSYPFMHALLHAYAERSGIPVLINTSLNLRGQPLSQNIDDTLSIAKQLTHPCQVIYDGTLMV